MHHIQSTLTADSDEMTLKYLLRAYAQLASTVGASAFSPFVSNVLPFLIEAVSRKTDTLIGDDADAAEEEEDWETVEIEGKGKMAIRISALEEKVEAAENLVLLVQALGTSLPVEQLEKVVSVALPLLTVSHCTGLSSAGS
jgi:hypothetical protein